MLRLSTLFFFRRGTGDRNYVIKDATNEPVLTLVGPSCVCDGIYSCGCENRYVVSNDISFKVYLERFLYDSCWVPIELLRLEQLRRNI
jgi:hypothetical protein